MRRLVSLWLPPIVYLAIIFWLSAQSRPLSFLPERVFTFDKVLHAIEYAGLAVLLVRALLGSGLRAAPAAVLAIAVVVAYGASDEWHQSFVPKRDADPRDWAADCAGGAVGAALGAALLRVRRAQASIGH